MFKLRFVYLTINKRDDDDDDDDDNGLRIITRAGRPTVSE